jgi:dTDP-4-amino-4,6-dideoxy-D-galactose acyltransferase
MHLAEARKQQLYFYSPYNFIKSLSFETQIENCVFSVIRNFNLSPYNQIIDIDIEGKQHRFFISLLPWDTKYFGKKMIKLCYVLFDHNDVKLVAEAVKYFIAKLFKEKLYCFIEIPSEDIDLLLSLTSNGFCLVETRLTYYLGNIGAFKPERYPVRKANENDVQNLMRVAREMRNDYDRFHADPVFGQQIADEFLATYIEQSIKGLADVVLVPDEQCVSSDSFLTAKYLKNDWKKNGVNISKMVLSAVSSKTNKGWYKKLISEMTYLLHEEGAEFIYMNTQSTNRAVIHTWESLGYGLGSTTHILSRNNL